jgi:hypothetical protein
MSTNPTTPHQVGDAVPLHGRGSTTPGRITAIHRRDTNWTYVIRTIRHIGGNGDEVRIVSTSPDGSWISAINWPGSPNPPHSRDRADSA